MQRKKPNVLSLKTTDKIKEASQGTRVKDNPRELVIDTLQRIVNRYFDEANAREYVQFSSVVQNNHGYLTLNELELAFDLSINGVIEIDYIPKTLTFKYLTAVLKQYGGMSYPIKYPKGEESENKNDMRSAWFCMCRWVCFYKMFEDRSDKVELVDYLISAGKISPPDEWLQCSFAEKWDNADKILKWWLECCYPGVMIYDRDTNNPYNKGAITGPGNLRIQQFKESIGV